MWPKDKLIGKRKNAALDRGRKGGKKSNVPFMKKEGKSVGGGERGNLSLSGGKKE